MSDLDRLYDLLTAGSGVIRTRQPELEREATERALEARQQVGLNVTGTSTDLIIHPTQAVCESRLGPEWTGKGVGEIATWNYLFTDPIKSAADGLLNSAPHRAVLDNPSFMYWGAGIYTEFPEGETRELFRRWYFIVWLSKLAPPIGPRFSDVAPTYAFYEDIEFLAGLGIVNGYPDGTFKPTQPITRGEMTAIIARVIRKYHP